MADISRQMVTNAAALHHKIFTPPPSFLMETYLLIACWQARRKQPLARSRYADATGRFSVIGQNWLKVQRVMFAPHSQRFVALNRFGICLP